MATFGIDLGTTTTLIARSWTGKNPQDIQSEVLKIRQPNYEDDQALPYLPSVAYFPQEASPVVGLWAKERGHKASQGSLRCVRAVKRVMGKGLTLAEIGRTPYEVSSLYLETALDQALDGYDLDELTVTVPASYTTNQRRDVLRAIDGAFDRLRRPRLQGHQRERLLISEPVAALLAFVAWDIQKAPHTRQIDIDEHPKVLVYDIGGGTLDLTIVDLSWRDAQGSTFLDNLRFEVIGISRHNQFGGEDFDYRLAKECIYPRLLDAFPELRDLELSDEERLALRYDLVNEAERLKKELNLELEFGEEGVLFRTQLLIIRGQEYALTVELDRREYESLMAPFLRTTGAASKNALHPITELLEESQLTRQDIRYFLPVGGMSGLVPLRDTLEAYWSDEESFLRFPNPMEAIAQGAAVYSHIKLNHPDFRIVEPAADAYYVLSEEGPKLILPRNETVSERHRFSLTRRSDKLLLQIFAGVDPPKEGDLDSILHTLVYQGGTAIPLESERDEGTPVFIRMERRYDTKVPVVRVQVGEPSDFEQEIDFGMLEDR